MKFLALSLSALLSTLVYSSAAAAPPAAVYFFSHGRPSTSSIVSQDSSDSVPSLNLKETRAALAHLLNVPQPSRSHEKSAFIDVHGPIQQVFGQAGMSRKNLFETLGSNMVMLIESVENPNDVLPSFKPSFTVDSSEGLQDVISELGSSVPTKDRYLFNTHKSSSSGDALVNEHLVAEHHANVDVTVFDLAKKADALFLEESVSLGNYLESYEKKHSNGQGTDFVRITIKGLVALAKEHGVDSVHYKTAQRILKELLQSFIPEFEQIHKTYTTTIFLVAPTDADIGSGSFETFSSSTSPLKKRQLPLAPAASASCFLSELDCQTNTNGCSQQGVCVLSPAANCYHCQCSKINNTQYGGRTCSKIDVSIEFHLFFWLALGLILTVALAVGLILQMGNQSQGGVPVGPTRAQLKRD